MRNDEATCSATIAPLRSDAFFTLQPSPATAPAAAPAESAAGVGLAGEFEASALDVVALQPLPSPASPADEAATLSLDAVLGPYVIIFCIAFVVAYVFTPIMRHVALAYDVVDRPDNVRKTHGRIVAYLGGVAVFLGFVAALALGQFFAQSHHPKVVGVLRVPVPIILGTCVIVALGLIDDLRGVRPRLKIMGQIAAAVCLLSFGIGDDVAGQFVRYGFSWFHKELGLQVPGVVEAMVSVVASWVFVIALVVFCCNASNLMDGLDGLCGGVTAIIAVGLVAIAAHLAMDGLPGRAADDALRLAVSLALFGAVMGFLPFNFNPASIFMGDAGSLLMGFVVATMIVLLGEVGGKWMLGAMVMFSLPVLDTALAFARRYMKGRPLFSADKQHFHHQLMRRGLGVKKSVLIIYGLTLFFVLSGAFMVVLRTRYLVAFYLVLFGCIAVAAWKMGLVHERGADDGAPVPDDADADPAARAVAGNVAADDATPAVKASAAARPNMA